MGTLRHITDYILPPVLDCLEEQQKNRVKLNNERLVPSSEGYFEDPETPEVTYPDVVFIDDIQDEDYSYTMAYNAKVGTVMPILESNYSRFKDEWLICNGQDYYFKWEYPMLYNKIKNIFYNENAIGDEIPLYTKEFCLPKIKSQKLNSESDEKVIWIIKSGRKEQGNYYDKDDDLT